MKHALGVITLAAAVTAFGSVSAGGAELSPSEIAEILQIKAWRIPEPAKGREWSLEVVTELPTTSGRQLERGGALVSLRPTGDDRYEFVLKQLRAQSTGTMSPCREPEGSSPICEAYSLEFESRPRCLDDCSRAVLAHMVPMLGTESQRWLLLVAVPTLTIPVDDKTAVTPLP
jgi:hypothetical protein